MTGTATVTGEANLVVSDLAYDATDVRAGDAVTFTTAIANDGDAEGTQDVDLVIDGE